MFMLTLRVEDEEVVFGILKAMRHSLDKDDTCFNMDAIDTETSIGLQDMKNRDTLEACIIQENEMVNLNPTM